MTCDWQWAANYLANGRKKYDRPLYDRGLRISRKNMWDPSSDIQVGWQNRNPFVVYHQKGTTTIQAPVQQAHWGGMWSPLAGYSIRFTIQRYSGLQVVQRNFKFYLIEDDPARTPSKIQGCRSCSQTGLIDSYCHPDTCWNGGVGEDGQYTCDEHPGAIQLNPFRNWHYLPCEHGKTNGHTVTKGQTCYSCKGAKKREYGNKPVMMMWDGSPIKVKDGKIIKQSATLMERMLADYVEPIG